MTGGSGAARVLLVEMPFFPLETPSIALEVLKASLQRAGIACHVEYLNLRFGGRLGTDLYHWAAEGLPPHLLLGDLVFAPSLDSTAPSPDRLRQLVARLAEGGEPLPAPEHLVRLYPALVAAARDFLDESLLAVDWRGYGLVGLSTMFNVVPSLALARLVKTLEEPPLVILGGFGCEGEMGEQLHRSFGFVDFVCQGDGERLIVELARSLAGGPAALERIDGLVWRDSGTTRCNGRRSDLRRGRGSTAGPPPPARASRPRYVLDALPVPRYEEWLGQARRSRLVEVGELRLPIQTSRGCSYGERRQCAFCGLNGAEIAFRRKSPRRVVGEIRDLVGHGVRTIESVDNILDRRYFRSLLPELARVNQGCELFWETRANLTHGQVEALRTSGIVWIQPGIESLSTAVLKLMGKGVTAFQNVRLLRYAAELGIGAGWNILWGLPGENPADYLQMAELLPALSHLQPPWVGCLPIRVCRFAPLFERKEEWGLDKVEPAPAYFEVYPFERTTVARLAYYFQGPSGSSPTPPAHVASCAEAVSRWQGEVGRAALICFGSGPALHVVDSRAAATSSGGMLRGLERDVFHACEHGASLRAIAGRLRKPAREIRAVLHRLLECRWVVTLDGRYLSLAVAVDSQVPTGVPPVMVQEALRQAYCRRMVRLRDGMSRRLPGRPRVGRAIDARDARSVESPEEWTQPRPD